MKISSKKYLFWKPRGFISSRSISKCTPELSAPIFDYKSRYDTCDYSLHWWGFFYSGFFSICPFMVLYHPVSDFFSNFPFIIDFFLFPSSIFPFAYVLFSFVDPIIPFKDGLFSFVHPIIPFIGGDFFTLDPLLFVPLWFYIIQSVIFS